MVQLCVIAAIRGSEPHLPISLVSISAAESTVTCASHDSALRHHSYTRPVSPDRTSVELSEALTAHIPASQSVRQQSSATESGGHVDNEDPGSPSSGCDGGTTSAVTSHSNQHTGQHTPCVQNLKALDVKGVNQLPSSMHRQQTNHDRQQGDLELMRAPESNRARGDESPGQASQPVGRESQRCNGCTAGSHAQPELAWQALEEIRTEAVSALTVIESGFRFTADDGSSEQLLSGFQVGPESCTAHTFPSRDFNHTQNMQAHASCAQSLCSKASVQCCGPGLCLHVDDNDSLRNDMS